MQFSTKFEQNIATQLNRYVIEKARAVESRLAEPIVAMVRQGQEFYIDLRRSSFKELVLLALVVHEIEDKILQVYLKESLLEHSRKIPKEKRMKYNVLIRLDSEKIIKYVLEQGFFGTRPEQIFGYLFQQHSIKISIREVESRGPIKYLDHSKYRDKGGRVGDQHGMDIWRDSISATELQNWIELERELDEKLLNYWVNNL